MTMTVSAEAHGKTVKEYLHEISISSRALRFLKAREKGIMINGKAVTVRAILSAGDTLFLALEEEDVPSKRTAPTTPPPDLVLYEDEHILVVNKPAGMPTHPSQGHRGDTLSDAVLAMPNAPLVFRAVNRLDRGTSGVVLIARNRFASSFLSREMEKGNIRKEYLAIIEKPIFPPSGRMTDGIRREADSIIRRVACPVGEGDYAEADYETLRVADNGLTLLRLRPRTGRTHQLRVQLASRGYPIVGDDLYGGAPLLPRQALHAASLSFLHPNGTEMTIACDLPQDMSVILDKELP